MLPEHMSGTVASPGGYIHCLSVKCTCPWGLLGATMSDSYEYFGSLFFQEHDSVCVILHY